jgi:hypothetical protein
MASIAAAVAVGEITPGEAAELSRLVEAYMRAIEVSEFDKRLQAVEVKGNIIRPQAMRAASLDRGRPIKRY